MGDPRSCLRPLAVAAIAKWDRRLLSGNSDLSANCDKTYHLEWHGAKDGWLLFCSFDNDNWLSNWVNYDHCHFSQKWTASFRENCNWWQACCRVYRVHVFKLGSESVGTWSAVSCFARGVPLDVNNFGALQGRAGRPEFFWCVPWGDGTWRAAKRRPSRVLLELPRFVWITGLSNVIIKNSSASLALAPLTFALQSENQL